MRRTTLFAFSMLGFLALTSVVFAVRVRLDADLTPVSGINAGGRVDSDINTQRPDQNEFRARLIINSGSFTTLGVNPASPAGSSVSVVLSDGTTVALSNFTDMRVNGVGDVTWDTVIRGASAPAPAVRSTVTAMVNGGTAATWIFRRGAK